MRVASRSPDVDVRLQLLDGLIYGDVFDCALTFDELWRYGRAPIDRQALRRWLREDLSLRRLVVERDGFYGFADRSPALLTRRPARIQRARRLERRARRVANVLRHVPFVRGVALTGSAAADHAADGADVDLMLIVASSRVGTVFLMLGSASRLLGRRVFCPNYYVCEGHVATGPTSLYVARELAQARILVGGGAIPECDPWLAEVFPNAPTAVGKLAGRGGAAGLQRVLEAPLRGRLGGWLERRARTIADARLRAHYGARGEDVPPEVATSLAAGRALRFHGGRTEETTLGRYVERREEIAARLRALDGERPQARESAR